MKLSIITPVYNAVCTLEKTIISVLSQNLNAELEYIVVDGGSTDGSLEIIDRYAEQINIFISEKDRGVYDAMNKGILCATGDVIGIINADDWYVEDALSIVEEIFQEQPSVEILYSPINNYLNGCCLNTFVPGTLENLIFKFTINHPSCFVKRAVYSQIGLFDLQYTIAADYDFILRAYLAGIKFYYTEKSLACYSLNGMSGKPLNKFNQIRESWQVGSSNLFSASKQLKRDRQKFYLVWLFKEIVLLPLKLTVDLRLIKRLKEFIREKTGIISSDQYGAW